MKWEYFFFFFFNEALSTCTTYSLIYAHDPSKACSTKNGVSDGSSSRLLEPESCSVPSWVLARKKKAKQNNGVIDRTHCVFIIQRSHRALHGLNVFLGGAVGIT